MKLNSPIWLRYRTTSNSVGDKTLKKMTIKIYKNVSCQCIYASDV